jgi:hypothetical protein
MHVSQLDTIAKSWFMRVIRLRFATEKLIFGRVG